MLNRRKFLQASAYTSLSGLISLKLSSCLPHAVAGKKDLPIVISTWDAGIAANEEAWEVLRNNGRALDAVEKGVMVTEASNSCCVGLNGNPDRDGTVSLDASIMDENFNCGGVADLKRIKHPISVARRVMEKTPHVLLVGEGAQQFAVAEGFPLEPEYLSPKAAQNYEKWLQKSEYKPVINIENKGDTPIVVPAKMPDGNWNHDTIGMIAMDATGNLSGSCTTSGMAFKMHGRVGDSPIIGAGLYVDNEVGGCAATGQGEDVIRIGGAAIVVEFMRMGMSPAAACKKAIERIAAVKKEKAKDIQVAFIALAKDGTVGAYALQKGFTYAVTDKEGAKFYNAHYHLK